MNTLITPNKAIEIVLERRTKPLVLKPYETEPQKYLFWASLACMGIGSILGLVFNKWPEVQAFYIGNGAVLIIYLSVVLVVFYQVAVIWPQVATLRHSEKNLSLPIASEFNDDIDLINELARDFKAHHLEYAQDSFSLLAERLRSRISFLVGAIDKVGVIPLAITAYISVQKNDKSVSVVFSEVEWILVVLIFLYILAAHMQTVAQKLDQISLIYKHALAVQKANS